MTSDFFINHHQIALINPPIKEDEGESLSLPISSNSLTSFIVKVSFFLLTLLLSVLHLPVMIPVPIRDAIVIAADRPI